MINFSADHSAGYTDDERRTLLDEAEASGPATIWNADAVKAEILKRYAARR